MPLYTSFLFLLQPPQLPSHTAKACASPVPHAGAANAIGAVTIAIISSCCAVLALVALMGTRAWATTQSAAASVIDRAAKRHGWTQQRAKMLMRLLGVS